ncbi:hypothetical protein JCM1393_26640 [Clostridium carnis]
MLEITKSITDSHILYFIIYYNYIFITNIKIWIHNFQIREIHKNLTVGFEGIKIWMKKQM